MSQTPGALAQPAPRDWFPILMGLCGGLFAALLFAAAEPPGLALVGMLAAFALAACVVAAQPFALLVAFTVFLPIHLLIMVMLFNAGIDHTLIRAYSAWKEIVALGLLAILLLQRTLLGRRRAPHVLDVAVLLFAALNILYAFFPVMSPIDVPLGARLQGLRDNAFFAILYGIGRLAPLTVGQVRLFAAVAIGIGTAGVVLGVAERFALPIEFFFDPLRFDYFMRDYLNLHYHTGIPYNFWTSVGNVRRGVSFYLGSHHFAMASAMLIPLILCLRRPVRTFPNVLRTPLLVLAVIGLVLPLTRSVVLACLLQVLLIGWLTRRPHYTLVSALSVMLLLGTSLLFLDLSGYVRSIAASRSSSVASHLASWQDTRDIVLEYPLGVGFGVADTVAERTAGGPAGVMAGEGEYAFVVTSIGIPGLLLFLLVIGTAAGMLLHTWNKAPGVVLRQLALVALALLVGYAVVGVFTQVRHVPAFLFPLWWLIGTVAGGAVGGDQQPAE